MLPPGDIPDPGTEPESLVSPALEGELFTTGLLGSSHICITESLCCKQ